MKKGFSAVQGVILMVVIVVAIAGVLLLQVNKMDNNNANGSEEKDIYFTVINYGLDENNSLWFKTGFINDHKEMEAKLRIELEHLIFENRTISERIPALMMTREIIIEEGESIQEFTEITEVSNIIYSLKISLLVDNKTIGTHYLVINKE
jgi:flagellin-like protein